tara:strand:- start:488 stop:1096 length:609 start_codon:yes stop_codon:yes gene_type:complete
MKKGTLIFLSSSIIAPVFIYLSILALSSSFGIESILVIRDLAQTCGYPIGVGLISNLGILIWTASASITLFTSLSGLIEKREKSNFLFLGGILTCILCIDDFFLLHDRYIGPDFLYITYSILGIYILIKFRKLILDIDFLPFIISVFFLALSIIFDKFIQQLFANNYTNIQIMEEGFKFIGIVCWMNFWWKASIKSLRSRNS